MSRASAVSQRKPSKTSPLQRLAARQLADYDAGEPGTMFAEGIVLDEPQAYQLQMIVTQLRRDRGERTIGYKVGCTSPTIRRQLGIDHCVSGRLFDSERHSSGAVLSRARFANLAIEGELAVELAHPPQKNDFRRDQLPSCVAYVFPVIELHNNLMRGDRATPGELIANNAIHAGFVAGSEIAYEIAQERSLADASVSIVAGDRLLDSYAGPSLVRTINTSLSWLDESVRARGEELRSGEIILTGSIPSLIPIDENCSIRVDAPPFGSVEVVFAS